MWAGLRCTPTVDGRRLGRVKSPARRPRGRSGVDSWRYCRDKAGPPTPSTVCGERGKRLWPAPPAIPGQKGGSGGRRLSGRRPGGAVVGVRDRESRSPGEGRQRVRDDKTGRWEIAGGTRALAAPLVGRGVGTSDPDNESP